jgi:hypothetical protein
VDSGQWVPLAVAVEVQEEEASAVVLLRSQVHQAGDTEMQVVRVLTAATTVVVVVAVLAVLVAMDSLPTEGKEGQDYRSRLEDQLLITPRVEVVASIQVVLLRALVESAAVE